MPGLYPSGAGGSRSGAERRVLPGSMTRAYLAGMGDEREQELEGVVHELVGWLVSDRVIVRESSVAELDAELLPLLGGGSFWDADGGVE